MTDPVISLSSVTKGYGYGRGIFDIDLAVQPGTIHGYVGTNGSGKTTTLRTIMGFIRPDGGTAQVNGKDCWQDATALKEFVSYIPGEISFPDFRTGMDFLQYQAKFLGLGDLSRMETLLKRLELDASANLRRMSKGMKQKTAIVAAFMADKQLLVLDEPTTGLDPLMRDVFLELVREERQKGKTILMSTHIFEEVEEVCDAVSLIHNGRILRTAPVADLLHAQEKVFRIRFESPVSAVSVPLREAQIFGISETELRVQIPARSIGALLTWLAGMPVAAMHEEKHRLEQSFQQILKEEGGARA